MKDKTKESQIIETERGWIHATDLSVEELKEMGYGYWCTTHRDGKHYVDYDIYANGTRAYAIKRQEPQKER